MSDLVFTSAVQMTARMQAGEISARELVGAHLDRIDDVNPSLNAIVTLDPERAMAGAAQADDVQASGSALGVLHGLPIPHKDLVATAGMRTTLGSPIFATQVPDADDLIVERYREEIRMFAGMTRAMPPNNLTGMTDEERALIRAWGRTRAAQSE